MSQTLLRSETALTSCLQPNGNPEGINTEDTLAWSAQKMSLILHRQVTGDPPRQEKMVGVPGRLAAHSKEASQVFRTVGHNFEARLASNANRTYYCDHHQDSENDAKPELQLRLSTSVWNAKTGGIKGYCGFINGCTAQFHRWQKSQPPSIRTIS